MKFSITKKIYSLLFVVLCIGQTTIFAKRRNYKGRISPVSYALNNRMVQKRAAAVNSIKKRPVKSRIIRPKKPLLNTQAQKQLVKPINQIEKNDAVENIVKPTVINAPLIQRSSQKPTIIFRRSSSNNAPQQNNNTVQNSTTNHLPAQITNAEIPRQSNAQANQQIRPQMAQPIQGNLNNIMVNSDPDEAIRIMPTIQNQPPKQQLVQNNEIVGSNLDELARKSRNIQSGVENQSAITHMQQQLPKPLEQIETVQAHNAQNNQIHDPADISNAKIDAETLAIIEQISNGQLSQEDFAKLDPSIAIKVMQAIQILEQGQNAPNKDNNQPKTGLLERFREEYNKPISIPIPGMGGIGTGDIIPMAVGMAVSAIDNAADEGTKNKLGETAKGTVDIVATSPAKSIAAGFIRTFVSKKIDEAVDTVLPNDKPDSKDSLGKTVTKCALKSTIMPKGQAILDPLVKYGIAAGVNYMLPGAGLAATAATYAAQTGYNTLIAGKEQAIAGAVCDSLQWATSKVTDNVITPVTDAVLGKEEGWVRSAVNGIGKWTQTITNRFTGDIAGGIANRISHSLFGG